jgi:hypothetical protein
MLPSTNQAPEHRILTVFLFGPSRWAFLFLSYQPKRLALDEEATLDRSIKELISMSGSKPRIKGNRVENRLKNMLIDAGIACHRQPDSGAFGTINKRQELRGDLCINNDLRAEVKARKNGEGFKVLEGWMGDNDYLFLVRDRATPMVVMSWERYVQLESK